MHAKSTCEAGDPHIEMKSDGEKIVLVTSVTKSDRDNTSLSKPTTSPELSPQTPEWSMVSVSPRSPTRLGPLLSPGVSSSAQDPDWNMLSASPRQSPPIQMMGQPTGYDPNRIPSSIFGRKPTSAMEWSVASNDSLFSLQMGNNSFPRDHANLVGASEQVTNNDESNNSSSSHHPVTKSKSKSKSKSNGLNNFLSSLPTVFESSADNDRQCADTGEETQVKEVAEETPKSVSKGTAEDQGKKKVPPADRPHTSASTSGHSSESGNSGGSFAFPILAGGSGTSAPVKVVPEKPSGGDGTTTSEKAAPEKPQSHPQTPAVTSSTAVTKRFFCFSCCALCC